MSLNFALGIAFLAVGVIGSVLQYWLWTYPMVPDPSGRDPNGLTTAPPFWRAVHRWLGYVFLAIYIVLMARMVPRLPFLEDETANVSTYVHIVAGFVIAPILGFKIFIFRRYQKLGNRLRFIGTIVLALTFVIIATIYSPAQRIQSLPASTEFEARAVAKIQSECFRCHGATPIVNHERANWDIIVEAMEEIGEEKGRPMNLGSDREAVIAYLEKHFPRPSDDDSGQGRGRGRGRGGDEDRDED